MIRALPQEKHETDRFWSEFPNSRAQVVLHNELVQLIEIARGRLEDATDSDNIRRLQAQIKACKDLIGIIHRKDPVPATS